MGAERPLYGALGVAQDASQDEVRKAYRRLALQLHPDKNPSEEAKGRFQDLQRVYAILGDAEKRKVYDDTGETDEDAGAFSSEAVATMAQYFRSLYAKVTPEEIARVEREYRGSREEAADVLRHYARCEGRMSAVFTWVMCCEPKWDEHRFAAIIEAGIREGRAPRHPAFTAWAKQLARRRPPPGDPLLKGEAPGGAGGGDMSALVAAIRKRGAPEQDSFFASLEAKYCGAGPQGGKAGKGQASRRGRGRGAEGPPGEADEAGGGAAASPEEAPQPEAPRKKGRKGKGKAQQAPEAEAEAEPAAEGRPKRPRQKAKA